MERGRKETGFSLTETLIAVGILAIGMMFIAGVFPVGIHFTTISTERSIAAAVADEAFGKIQLHEVDFNVWPRNINGVLEAVPFRHPLTPFRFVPVFEDFYSYPSQPLATGEPKQYFWSAICRVVDLAEREVQVTVFVSRKVGTGLLYYERDPADPCDVIANAAIPSAMWVRGVPNPQAQSQGRELIIYRDAGETDPVDRESLVNEGSVIVDGMTGERYRVLERLPRLNPGADVIVVLDRAMATGNPRKVWLVPPPVGGGRNPCIGVFQKEIRF